LKAEKPTVTIFNKMDKYEVEAFDQWMEPEVKNELLIDLKKRWQNETKRQLCICVSYRKMN
jgi:GTP-binding protein HflX